MKAVDAYCRSGWDPRDGRSSVLSQAHELRRYAGRRGLTIRRAYTDRATSGMTLDRSELGKLIADCRAGKIGTIVTTDPERLSRDTGQLVELHDIFRKTGVRVEFTTAAGWPRFDFLRIVLSAVAELEETANA